MHPRLERFSVMMDDRSRPIDLERNAYISLRIAKCYKQMLHQAAEQEGLQLSSFAIWCFIRLKYLPEICLKGLALRAIQWVKFRDFRVPASSWSGFLA